MQAGVATASVYIDSRVTARTRACTARTRQRRQLERRGSRDQRPSQPN